MTKTLLAHLSELMPELASCFKANVPLSGLTWFRVGGPAEILFRAENEEALSLFLKKKPRDLPVFVLGGGSNILARDGGVKGVVIRLGTGFSQTEIKDGAKLRIGAAVSDQTIADIAQKAGIGGFAFLAGIPGTLGGALRMNAGAFGGEIKDVVTLVEAFDPEGNHHLLDLEAMKFGYRQCGIPKDWIFTAAFLQGHFEAPEAIALRMAEIDAARAKVQPIHARTGGSTFANPEGLQAWKLIDDAGCRGMRRGHAEVSTLHCNFLLNLGGATSADIEDLGEDIRAQVKAHSGIDLRWEILRIGEREAF